MKYLTRITVLIVFIIVLNITYQYFIGFFELSYIALWDAEQQIQVDLKGLDMLKSPFIWTPLIISFLAGMCCISIAKIIAQLAYDTDEADQIKKYKQIAEEAEEKAKNAMLERELDLDHSKRVFEQYKQAENDKIEKLTQQAQQQTTESSQQWESCQTKIAQVEADLTKKYQEYNTKKAQLSLWEQQLSAFKATTDKRIANTNTAFGRIHSKKERTTGRIEKLERQIQQKDTYIKQLRQALGINPVR